MAYFFKFSLTEEEYADYNVFACWRAPWQKDTRLKTVLRLFLLSLVTAGAVIMIAYPPKDQNIVVSIAIVLGSSLLGTFAGYSLVAAKTRTRAIKFVQNDENKSLLDEKEVEISDDRVSYTNKSTSMTIDLSSIVRYHRHTKYFYLFLNQSSALIIPDRLFRSQAEIEEFDRFLIEHIPLSSSIVPITK
jgi:hypothetical protein